MSRASSDADLGYAALAADVRAAACERELARARQRLAELEMERATRELTPLRGLLAPISRRRRAVRADVRAAGGAGPCGVARIPLAGMHEVGGISRWGEEVRIDGVTLSSVPADPPWSTAFRIVGAPCAWLRAFVGLRCDAWPVNRGGVRFSAHLLTLGGAELRSAAMIVDPASRRGDRRWRALELDLGGLPAEEFRLELRTAVPEGAAPNYAWAYWGDPVVHVGHRGELRHRRRSIEALGSVPEWIRARRPERRGSADGAVPEHPVISLLVPVHDPDPVLLDGLLDSVRRQTSPHWQLCLSDDGSTDPAVRERLSAAAHGDRRIALIRAERPGGISAATNAALNLASGRYVATVDHDDLLTQDAVARVGRILRADPSIDMLYTDNDKVLHDGLRLAPALKPAWTPEQLRALMYTLHLGVYRRRLVEELGGWRSEFDGAQDHDLVLRIGERSSRIVHLPGVAYHWRVHPGSAALRSDAKPQAAERGRRAVDEHLQRTGTRARAVCLPTPGRYRVVYQAPEAPVDILLPLPADLAGPDLGSAVAEAVRGLACASARVTVITAQVTAAVGGVAREAGAAVVDADGRWGTLARAGLEATEADVVILLEEVCRPEQTGWLDELCGLACEPSVAAAGGLVIDQDGQVVHAGVALPRGVPLPVHPGAPADGMYVPDELTFVTGRSAASGAVAVRRERLRLGPVPDGDRHGLAALTSRLGGRVAVSPHARLRVIGEPRGGVAGLAELAAIARSRGTGSDPYFNPLLWGDRAVHRAPETLSHGARA